MCDFLHIGRVRLMCFSFFVLWVSAIIALAGNLTARVSILHLSLVWLVLVASSQITVLYANFLRYRWSPTITIVCVAHGVFRF